MLRSNKNLVQILIDSFRDHVLADEGFADALERYESIENSGESNTHRETLSVLIGELGMKGIRELRERGRRNNNEEEDQSVRSGDEEEIFPRKKRKMRNSNIDYRDSGPTSNSMQHSDDGASSSGSESNRNNDRNHNNNHNRNHNSNHNSNHNRNHNRNRDRNHNRNRDRNHNRNRDRNHDRNRNGNRSTNTDSNNPDSVADMDQILIGQVLGASYSEISKKTFQKTISSKGFQWLFFPKSNDAIICHRTVIYLCRLMPVLSQMVNILQIPDVVLGDVAKDHMRWIWFVLRWMTGVFGAEIMWQFFIINGMRSVVSVIWPCCRACTAKEKGTNKTIAEMRDAADKFAIDLTSFDNPKCYNKKELEQIEERVSMKHNDYSVGYRINRYLGTPSRSEWFRWNDDRKQLTQMMFVRSPNPLRSRRSPNRSSKDDKNWMNWGIGLKKVDWRKWVPGCSMIPLKKIMDTVVPFNVECKKDTYKGGSFAPSLKRYWIHHELPYAKLAWGYPGQRDGWPDGPIWRLPMSSLLHFLVSIDGDSPARSRCPAQIKLTIIQFINSRFSQNEIWIHQIRSLPYKQMMSFIEGQKERRQTITDLEKVAKECWGWLCLLISEYSMEAYNKDSYLHGTPFFENFRTYHESRQNRLSELGLDKLPDEFVAAIVDNASSRYITSYLKMRDITDLLQSIAPSSNWNCFFAMNLDELTMLIRAIPLCRWTLPENAEINRLAQKIAVICFFAFNEYMKTLTDGQNESNTRQRMWFTATRYAAPYVEKLIEEHNLSWCFDEKDQKEGPEDWEVEEEETDSADQQSDDESSHSEDVDVDLTRNDSDSSEPYLPPTRRKSSITTKSRRRTNTEKKKVTRNNKKNDSRKKPRVLNQLRLPQFVATTPTTIPDGDDDPSNNHTNDPPKSPAPSPLTDRSPNSAFRPRSLPKSPNFTRLEQHHGAATAPGIDSEGWFTIIPWSNQEPEKVNMNLEKTVWKKKQNKLIKYRPNDMVETRYNDSDKEDLGFSLRYEYGIRVLETQQDGKKKKVHHKFKRPKKHKKKSKKGKKKGMTKKEERERKRKKKEKREKRKEKKRKRKERKRKKREDEGGSNPSKREFDYSDDSNATSGSGEDSSASSGSDRSDGDESGDNNKDAIQETVKDQYFEGKWVPDTVLDVFYAKRDWSNDTNLTGGSMTTRLGIKFFEKHPEVTLERSRSNPCMILSYEATRLICSDKSRLDALERYYNHLVRLNGTRANSDLNVAYQHAMVGILNRWTIGEDAADIITNRGIAFDFWGLPVQTRLPSALTSQVRFDSNDMPQHQACFADLVWLSVAGKCIEFIKYMDPQRGKQPLYLRAGVMPYPGCPRCFSKMLSTSQKSHGICCVCSSLDKKVKLFISTHNRSNRRIHYRSQHCYLWFATTYLLCVVIEMTPQPTGKKIRSKIEKMFPDAEIPIPETLPPIRPEECGPHPDDEKSNGKKSKYTETRFWSGEFTALKSEVDGKMNGGGKENRINSLINFWVDVCSNIPKYFTRTRSPRHDHCRFYHSQHNLRIDEGRFQTLDQYLRVDASRIIEFMRRVIVKRPFPRSLTRRTFRINTSGIPITDDAESGSGDGTEDASDRSENEEDVRSSDNSGSESVSNHNADNREIRDQSGGDQSEGDQSGEDRSGGDQSGSDQSGDDQSEDNQSGKNEDTEEVIVDDLSHLSIDSLSDRQRRGSTGKQKSAKSTKVRKRRSHDSSDMEDSERDRSTKRPPKKKRKIASNTTNQKNSKSTKRSSSTNIDSKSKAKTNRGTKRRQRSPLQDEGSGDERQQPTKRRKRDSGTKRRQRSPSCDEQSDDDDDDDERQQAVGRRKRDSGTKRRQRSPSCDEQSDDDDDDDERQQAVGRRKRDSGTKRRQRSPSCDEHSGDDDDDDVRQQTMRRRKRNKKQTSKGGCRPSDDKGSGSNDRDDDDDINGKSKRHGSNTRRSQKRSNDRERNSNSSSNKNTKGKSSTKKRHGSSKRTITKVVTQQIMVDTFERLSERMLSDPAESSNSRRSINTTSSNQETETLKPTGSTTITVNDSGDNNNKSQPNTKAPPIPFPSPWSNSSAPSTPVHATRLSKQPRVVDKDYMLIPKKTKRSHQSPVTAKAPSVRVRCFQTDFSPDSKRNLDSISIPVTRSMSKNRNNMIRSSELLRINEVKHHPITRAQEKYSILGRFVMINRTTNHVQELVILQEHRSADPFSSASSLNVVLWETQRSSRNPYLEQIWHCALLLSCANVFESLSWCHSRNNERLKSWLGTSTLTSSKKAGYRICNKRSIILPFKTEPIQPFDVVACKLQFSHMMIFSPRIGDFIMAERQTPSGDFVHLHLFGVENVYHWSVSIRILILWTSKNKKDLTLVLLCGWSKSLIDVNHVNLIQVKESDYTTSGVQIENTQQLTAFEDESDAMIDEILLSIQQRQLTHSWWGYNKRAMLKQINCHWTVSARFLVGIHSYFPSFFMHREIAHCRCSKETWLQLVRDRHDGMIVRLVRLMSSIPIQINTRSTICFTTPQQLKDVTPAMIAYISHAVADKVFGHSFVELPEDDQQRLLKLILSRWQFMLIDIAIQSSMRNKYDITYVDPTSKDKRGPTFKLHRTCTIPIYNEQYPHQGLFASIRLMESLPNSPLNCKRRTNKASKKEVHITKKRNERLIYTGGGTPRMYNRRKGRYYYNIEEHTVPIFHEYESRESEKDHG